ncbi:hypothetical protein [Actinoplanes sp. HUAS TT8]|uniref:hypothetical protein n=1 Tax=Actinoplanes sp. HUAS TT8 TaxID=3447453 RepID=UPI003F524492
MTVARYAARTAAFAAVYLLFSWVGWSFVALPVAAVWMLAQGHWGLRRFDVITLVTITTAASIAGGTSMLAGFGAAALITFPAMMFALLVERWLPGWWQGHGDRFRSRRTRLARVAAAAALCAVAFVVLYAVLLGIPMFGLLIEPVLLTAAVFVAALAGRALNRGRTPRVTGLTLVR